MWKSGEDECKDEAGKARERGRIRGGGLCNHSYVASTRRRACSLLGSHERRHSSYPRLLEELQRDISESQISLLIYSRNGSNNAASKIRYAMDVTR